MKTKIKEQERGYKRKLVNQEIADSVDRLYNKVSNLVNYDFKKSNILNLFKIEYFKSDDKKTTVCKITGRISLNSDFTELDKNQEKELKSRVPMITSISSFSGIYFEVKSKVVLKGGDTYNKHSGEDAAFASALVKLYSGIKKIIDIVITYRETRTLQFKYASNMFNEACNKQKELLKKY